MNECFHLLIYGLVNGLKLEWLDNLDKGLPRSNLVIVLDVSQKESFNRKKSNRDKFEKNKDFSQSISKMYKKIAKKKKWQIIDATQSKKQVHDEVMKIFRKKIGI